MELIDEIKARAWRKSTRCEAGACVEVAIRRDAVLVRDSKNPDLAPVRFDLNEWAALLGAVRAGEDPRAAFAPLEFTDAEITAFVEGARAGDFDLVPA